MDACATCSPHSVGQVEQHGLPGAVIIWPGTHPEVPLCVDGANDAGTSLLPWLELLSVLEQETGRALQHAGDIGEKPTVDTPQESG